MYVCDWTACLQVWCSVYSTPKTEDSTFIAVFDPHTREKQMQYSQLDSRISIMLPVKTTVSDSGCGL